MSVSVHQRDVAPEAVADCLRRVLAALLGLRRDDGSWLAPVDAGVSPAVDYLLLDAWLRRRGSSLGQAAGVAGLIRSRQESHGGFSTVAGGPFDLDLTVRAYAALRLNGAGRNEPDMARCLAAIHQAGGLEGTGVLARLDLSFAGLLPRDTCLSIPVELMLFQQRWLEPLAAWARAVTVPLAIIRTLCPEPECPPDFSGRELAANGEWPSSAGPGWLRWLDRNTPLPLRRAALRRAETWLLDRVNRADALQEAFPAIRYTVMALELLGYSRESAVRHRLSDCLDLLAGESGVQPYSAPDRDTALALRSIDEAALPVPGLAGRDWVRRPSRIEDMAMVLLAPRSRDAARDTAVEKSITELRAAQSDDGGWASLARSGRRSTPPKLAGIDPRTLTDRTSPGTTGLVLEAICRHGANAKDRAVRRAVEYLVRSQDLDGSWTGQWPGSYIGATCFAVTGLAAAGEDTHEAHVLRAGEWLRSVQNADGGWGEDAAAFDRGEYAPGESTAVQAAWALIGLMASGDRSSDSVRRGVAYLVETQAGNGEWVAQCPTGTWPAGALPTSSRLDCLCYPMLALARYQRVQGAVGGDIV